MRLRFQYTSSFTIKRCKKKTMYKIYYFKIDNSWTSEVVWLKKMDEFEILYDVIFF